MRVVSRRRNRPHVDLVVTATRQVRHREVVTEPGDAELILRYRELAMRRATDAGLASELAAGSR